MPPVFTTLHGCASGYQWKENLEGLQVPRGRPLRVVLPCAGVVGSHRYFEALSVQYEAKLVLDLEPKYKDRQPDGKCNGGFKCILCKNRPADRWAGERSLLCERGERIERSEVRGCKLHTQQKTCAWNWLSLNTTQTTIHQTRNLLGNRYAVCLKRRAPFLYATYLKPTEGKAAGQSTYVYIYIHICVWILSYLYIYTYIVSHIFVHTAMYVYIYIYIHILMNLHMHIYAYVYMYGEKQTYVHICIYIYIFIYLYIRICNIDMYTWKYIYMYIYIYVYDICTYVWLYAYIYMYISPCMYAKHIYIVLHIYIYVYICICKYLNIHVYKYIYMYI